MLVDNHGLEYQMKRDNVPNTMHWRCRYNKPPQSCNHFLRQIDPTSLLYTCETLQQSSQLHTCNPVAGIKKIIDFVLDVKTQGMKYRPHSSYK